jgi:hypothetical protein
MMAKKTRVKMHCMVCKKNTLHEIRAINGHESCVCLLCEAMPAPIEYAAVRDLNRYEKQKFETQNAIERERMRIRFPG